MSHIPYLFVVSFEKKKKYYIHYTLTTIKVYACYAVNFTKANPNFFFKTEGRGPGAPVLDPSLLSPVNPNPLQAFLSRKKTCSC